MWEFLRKRDRDPGLHISSPSLREAREVFPISEKISDVPPAKVDPEVHRITTRREMLSSSVVGAALLYLAEKANMGRRPDA